ncbi:nitrate/nitrite transporter [Corynebacterium sp.]|uniref:MFS transporter n=1 Tax=Corynebacterium sp. TaxID=1720 RepID=UPI0026DD13DF|nr:MFS transporter [Corynebacterium sp.]MDO4609062.1 MFS transporter [Corynebacterium sp.]
MTDSTRMIPGHPAPAASAAQPPKGRALAVWGVAVAVYLVAVLGRTSFGVAGVEAVDRFGVDATRLAVFTAVQVGVYAVSQIPVGILIDRFGPRRLLMAGALLMAAGQLVLALTASYPVAVGARVLIGAGDATAFLSVMRLLPAWFDMRRTPLLTQLTSAIGQMGQFLSAVPFLALLHGAGWTPAFGSLAAIGVLIAILAVVLVRDTPADAGLRGPRRRRTAAGAADTEDRIGTWAALRIVVRHPACWQGFFTHWVGLMGVNTFALLWGMPLMTLGMGLEPAAASSALVALTIAGIIASPFIGIISGWAGGRRDILALGVGALMIIGWCTLLLRPEPPAAAGLLAVLLPIGAITPFANIAFDTVRERVDRCILAAGTGLANMGGFTATMIAAQVIGITLDASAGGKPWAWSDFRTAFLAGIVGVIALGVAGLATSAYLAHRRPRRRTKLED